MRLPISPPAPGRQPASLPAHAGPGTRSTAVGRRPRADATSEAGRWHENRAVGVDHYENFPVASWLCPPELRPPIVAIYRFARAADDIADEGDGPVAGRGKRSGRLPIVSPILTDR